MPQEPEKLDVGRIIMTLRVDRGLSREALATSAGISPSYLYELERGLKRPTVDIVAKLAAALGMLPSQLLEQIEEPRPLADAVIMSPPEERRLAAGAYQAPSVVGPRMEPMPERPDEFARRAGAKKKRLPALVPPKAKPGRVTQLQSLIKILQRLGTDDLKVLTDVAKRMMKGK